MNEWLWRQRFENASRRVTTKGYIAELVLGTEVAGIWIAGTAGPAPEECLQIWWEAGPYEWGWVLQSFPEEGWPAGTGVRGPLDSNTCEASQTSIKKWSPEECSDSFVLTGWALEMAITLWFILFITFASVSSNWHHNGCRWKGHLKRCHWEFRS